jgi:ABC-type polysaccharide/polyol phosphate transport system ATPase subunit
MPVENVTDTPNASAASRRPPAPKPGDPLAIQVEDLAKAFRLPTQRVDSLKERIVHPFSGGEYRVLQALNRISFEVRQGEFFGIVGRNGSGKSTLLKLLASIYRPDAGRIRMAGRLAPFIELGVGFNNELTARENVVLNGVMMGLTPRETRNRLDAVIEFAELQEFVDLKLKNYSSGMLVRLAFSLMMEVDADILLIDEVLAVGDASFQQKCADAFHEMKQAGKTIVLVTHDMPVVEEYCHRAMLISDGDIQHIGDPAEVGRRYLRLNFEAEGGSGESAADVVGDSDESETIRVVSADVLGEDGRPARSLEHGEPIRIRLELEAKEDLPGVDVGFIVANADNIPVFQFGIPVGEDKGARDIARGGHVVVEATLVNPLASGRYFIHTGINRAFEGGIALFVTGVAGFVVYGGPHTTGIVYLDHTAGAEIEPGGER